LWLKAIAAVIRCYSQKIQRRFPPKPQISSVFERAAMRNNSEKQRAKTAKNSGAPL